MVTMKNAVFWNVTQCGFCKNRRYGGTHRFHHLSDKNRRARNKVTRNKQPKHVTDKYYVTSQKKAFFVM
jgi:hypothetical protein